MKTGHGRGIRPPPFSFGEEKDYDRDTEETDMYNA